MSSVEPLQRPNVPLRRALFGYRRSDVEQALHSQLETQARLELTLRERDGTVAQLVGEAARLAQALADRQAELRTVRAELDAAQLEVAAARRAAGLAQEGGGSTAHGQGDADRRLERAERRLSRVERRLSRVEGRAGGQVDEIVAAAVAIAKSGSEPDASAAGMDSVKQILRVRDETVTRMQRAVTEALAEISSVGDAPTQPEPEHAAEDEANGEPVVDDDSSITEEGEDIARGEADNQEDIAATAESLAAAAADAVQEVEAAVPASLRRTMGTDVARPRFTDVAPAQASESNGRVTPGSGAGSPLRWISVDVGPLRRFGQLVDFQDAIERLPGAHQARIDRFSGERARLEVALDESVDLPSELSRNSPFAFTVLDRNADCVVLDLQE